MTVRSLLLFVVALAQSVDARAQDTLPAPSIPAPVVQITGNPAPAATTDSAPAAVTEAVPAAAIPSPVVEVPAAPQPAAAATVAAPTAEAAAAVANPAASLEPVATTADDIGTTIIGDQESPIGLYITPWKDDYAERGLDRPARLLDEAMEPIDPATFRRQIEYYETITEFRRQKRGEVK